MLKRCTLLPALLFAACGILNLGGTNADGTPKTGPDAIAVIREIGDAGLILYGTPWLRANMPTLFNTFDVDQDGNLTLAEIEAQVDLSKPGTVTALIVLAVGLMQARAQAYP